MRQVRANKKLGQHFLKDHSVLDTIMQAADIAPHDTVVEIGPGYGALTTRLVETKAHITAMEVDETCIQHCKKIFAKEKNIDIIKADARTADFPKKPWKLVANIPYYLTGMLLQRLLAGECAPPFRMVLLIQKEVAEKMVHTKKRTVLYWLTLLSGSARIVCTVPPAAFTPPPKVHSAVLAMEAHAKPRHTKALLATIEAGFTAPRKKIVHSLALGLKKNTAKVSALLAAAGISPDLRPSNLEENDWRTLSKLLEKER